MSRKRSECDPTRLCLTGGWFSSRNVGDNAILCGLCDALSQRSAVALTVFTAVPENVRDHHGLPAIAPKYAPFSALAKIRGCHGLLYTGGTPFYDDPVHMLYFAMLATAARAFRVPVVVSGISLRTLSRPLCRAMTRYICRSARYVGAREHRSQASLRDLLSAEVDIRLLPDPATQMQAISASAAEAELAGYGAGDGLRIGICLRDLATSTSFQKSHYSSRFTPAHIHHLTESLVRLCRVVIKKHHGKIVFFPMNTISPDDDRVPARAVVDRLGSAGAHCHVVDRQYGPREMKGMLARMTAVVGVRFHSLVLAASAGVPTYALGYAPKNHAIMKYFGRSEYCQAITKLKGDRLIDGIDRTLRNLESEQRSVALRNDEIDRAFDNEIRLVKKVIGTDNKEVRQWHDGILMKK